jgi:hypothetical protein
VPSPYEAAEIRRLSAWQCAGGFQASPHQQQFCLSWRRFRCRDHTPFPLYAALAAMFFANRPVRLANIGSSSFNRESRSNQTLLEGADLQGKADRADKKKAAW